MENKQSSIKPVRVAGLEIGGGAPLVLIAGPCVIENEAHTLRMATALRDLTARLGLGCMFKASFDKANRSSGASFRGPGLAEGLRILERVRQDTGLAVTSDIHTTEQAREAASVLDVIQIPAFLSRQTDILVAAAQTGRPVNVKKGPFLAPWDVAGILGKLEQAGAAGILLTERGTCFGYNQLITDFRAIPIMRALGYPVVFDATHSVQEPGGQGVVSGGRREFVPALCRAAAAVGVDALFLEVHDDPEHAPCDGPNMLPVSELEPLLSAVMDFDRLAKR